MVRRRAVATLVLLPALVAALAGCGAPAAHRPDPSIGPSAVPSPTTPATAPASPLPPSAASPSDTPPPEVEGLRWVTTRFPDQARLEWSLPRGTTSVDAFRIRYTVNGRERVTDTEYFFLVLTGLHHGDEVRALVLCQGESGDSGEVASPVWRQP